MRILCALCLGVVRVWLPPRAHKDVFPPEKTAFVPQLPPKVSVTELGLADAWGDGRPSKNRAAWPARQQPDHAAGSHAGSRQESRVVVTELRGRCGSRLPDACHPLPDRHDQDKHEALRYGLGSDRAVTVFAPICSRCAVSRPDASCLRDRRQPWCIDECEHGHQGEAASRLV